MVEKRSEDTEHHPLRRDCDRDCRRVDDLETWQHDFQKPDGLLNRIYSAIGTKVSSAVYFWITGFILLFLAGSYGYTKNVSDEHFKFATVTSVEVATEKIGKVEATINTNQKAIMKSLDAIRRGE